MNDKKPSPTFAYEIVFDSANGIPMLSLLASKHFRAWQSRQKVGSKGIITVVEKKLTRSQSQLSYHWVLVGYIAAHTGYTEEVMHDVIMKEKFGVELVTFKGKTYEQRRSVRDGAMDKTDMGELIEYDLALCAELGITVPTFEELGGISNY